MHDVANLVPRAHVPFGQHQATELWNNQFPETKILGLPVSRRTRGLVYMASRDKFDVDTFLNKGIQYALEKLGKSKFGFERKAVSNFSANVLKFIFASVFFSHIFFPLSSWGRFVLQTEI